MAPRMECSRFWQQCDALCCARTVPCCVVLCTVLCTMWQDDFVHIACLCHFIQRHSIRIRFGFSGDVVDCSSDVLAAFELLVAFKGLNYVFWMEISRASVDFRCAWMSSVHKAHCRHINIPISLTYICSRLLLLLYAFVSYPSTGCPIKWKVYLPATWCEWLSPYKSSHLNRNEPWAVNAHCVRLYSKSFGRKYFHRCPWCSAASQVNSVARWTIYGRRLYSKMWCERLNVDREEEKIHAHTISSYIMNDLYVANDKLIAMTICTCSNIHFFSGHLTPRL